MSIKQNALDALIAYLDLHIAWKDAPQGPARLEAKRKRDAAHGPLIESAKLYKPQHKPER